MFGHKEVLLDLLRNGLCKALGDTGINILSTPLAQVAIQKVALSRMLINKQHQPKEFRIARTTNLLVKFAVILV